MKAPFGRTFLVVFLCCIPLSGLVSAQSPAPVPPASGSASAGAPAAQPPGAQTPPATRDVSWKLLVPNLLHDQKTIWTFPAKLAQGRDWIPTAAVLGTAAALVAADPHEASYFRNTTAYKPLNNVLTSNSTIYATIAVPVGMYGAGLIFHDSKMQKTALFMGEAVGDAEILTTVLKDATKRARPSGIPQNGNYWDSWYDSRGSVLRSNGGFPSGHTIAAFSMATIIARRYGNHRWVPYAAYGLAAVVGFSRMTLSAHFASDVFMGAALGYSIGRFVVLPQQ